MLYVEKGIDACLEKNGAYIGWCRAFYEESACGHYIGAICSVHLLAFPRYSKIKYLYPVRSDAIYMTVLDIVFLVVI